MTENRKRNQTLTIRVTAAEKDAIVRNAAKARMSLTDYIVAIFSADGDSCCRGYPSVTHRAEADRQ